MKNMKIVLVATAIIGSSTIKSTENAKEFEKQMHVNRLDWLAEQCDKTTEDEFNKALSLYSKYLSEESTLTVAEHQELLLRSDNKLRDLAALKDHCNCKKLTQLLNKRQENNQCALDVGHGHVILKEMKQATQRVKEQTAEETIKHLELSSR